MRQLINTPTLRGACRTRLVLSVAQTLSPGSDQVKGLALPDYHWVGSLSVNLFYVTDSYPFVSIDFVIIRICTEAVVFSVGKTSDLSRPRLSIGADAGRVC